MTTFLPTLLITAAALAAGLAPGAAAAATATATASQRAALTAAPAPGTSGSGFVANHGQWDKSVLYMAPIQGGRAWVTATGIVYDFTKAAKPKRGKQGERGAQPPKVGPKVGPQAERVQGHVVRLGFAGAVQPAVRPKGKLKTRLNYLIGNDPAKHAANVPAYSVVSLEGLWPGVDLRLAQGPEGLRLSFQAADAAALAKARLAVEGASVLTGRGEGAVVATSLGQRSLGSVAVSLGAVRHAGQLSGGTVALAPNRPVGQVDEAQAAAASEAGGGLVYSTYLGMKGGTDHGDGLAVDASGATYIAGSTSARNFPTTPGAYDITYNGSYGDAFVTKLSADGSTLIYSTFLGGNDGDGAEALAVDASGAAYVTGSTFSSNFPTTPGAFEPIHNNVDNSDAFVTKLSADGSALIYSTFLGGEDYDEGFALAVDASAAVYVTGTTTSHDLPTTPGAFDTTFNDYGYDTFVAKLSADGSALVYSTALGGDDDEFVSGLAVDTSGAVYVAGETWSNDFPTTPGAFDTTLKWSDVFVTKLAADGSALVYSTFIGGRSEDQGNGLAVDASGAAYVTGETWSSDFPATPGAFDTTFSGYHDAFVTKLSADGSALVYSTALNGKKSEGSLAIAVDASGAAHVAGWTESSNWPTTPGAYDTTYNGDGDAFVSKLSPDGAALVYSTFLGGASNDDSGYALALDASGAAHVTGITYASDFPTTPGAFDTNGGGSAEAFVTKFDLGSAAGGVDLIATASPTTVAAGGSFTVNYTVNNHTGDPVTGDLFFTASSGGSRVGRGMVLADTTVAAHGAITGSFTQLVPDDAVPGVYTYTVRVGQHPNRTADKVAFTITVTGAQRAGGGATAWKAVSAKR